LIAPAIVGKLKAETQCILISGRSSMVSSATQHRAQPDATTGRPRVLVDCSSGAATVAAESAFLSSN